MKIVAFVVGIIAFIFYILSVQQSNKEKLLKFQIIANIFYAVQYMLLGVYVAALMNFVSVARLTTFYRYNKNDKNIPVYSLIIFTILILAVGLSRFDKNVIGALAIFINLIPIAITLLYTFSTWKNNMKVIRYVFTVSALLWMIYNFSVGAYASLLGNIFELSSGIVSIFRYRKTK